MESDDAEVSKTAENTEIVPIEEYTGQSMEELLNFILQHMLGLDELLLPCFTFWDERKKNIEQIETGEFEKALFHRLIHSIEEPHYILPSGSNFEGLNLPHIKFAEICVNESSYSERSGSEDEHAWVSDIDFMCVLTKVQIFEESQSQLSESNCILKKSELPGYAMLRIRNPELFPWKDIVQEYENSAYLSSSRFIEMMNRHAFSFCDSLENEQITNITVHGPAIQITKMPPMTKESGSLSEDAKLFLKKSVPGEDIVWSLECHDWPLQACEWSRRLRAWPDQDIVDSVVQKGCHLVPVASKQSQPPLSLLEWRLSFSSAEKTIAKLLNVLQRKVYLVAKALHYTHLKSFRVLSTYLLKTALFWHCESKENLEIWQYGMISRCFISFLDLIVKFLENRNWPHYFIPNNNLIRHSEVAMIQELQVTILCIRNNPLKALQECQNILVSSYVDPGEKSFNATFAPLLKKIESQEKEINPDAFFDCLWEIGNFYLLSQGMKQALHYYKGALVYAQRLGDDTHVDVLDQIKCYAFSCGEIDEAIACAEKQIFLMKKMIMDGKRESTSLYVPQSGKVETKDEYPELEQGEGKRKKNREISNEELKLEETMVPKSVCEFEMSVNQNNKSVCEFEMSVNQNNQEALEGEEKTLWDNSCQYLASRQDEKKMLDKEQDHYVHEGDKQQPDDKNKLGVVLSNLGYMYHIHAEQFDLVNQRQYWLNKAEETFKEALSFEHSSALCLEYGNFLLHGRRFLEAKSLLLRGLETLKRTHESSYIVVENDEEKCILDQGIINILDDEGSVAIPSYLYCQYLLVKCFLGVGDHDECHKWLAKLELDCDELNDSDVGKLAALYLLKQALLACNLKDKAEEVKSRIVTLEEDEYVINTAALVITEDEAEGMVEIDLSQVSRLASFSS